MATKEEKLRMLKGLSKKEMEVVWYFCSGKSDDEICQLLGDQKNPLTLKALQARRTGIYKNLHINVPDKNKQDYLFIEYRDLVFSLIASEDELKRWKPGILEGGQEESRPPRPPILLGAIFSILVLAAVAWYFYNLGRGAGPENPATQVPVTLDPLASPTLATDTPPLTFTLTNVVLPTGTPITPTITPIPPSQTPVPPTPEFYEQGQWQMLRDGVFISLSDKFSTRTSGTCPPPEPGFSVVFNVRKSTNDEFIIRFDPTAFHAQDNLGNEYQLAGSGIFRCNAIGIVEYSANTETPISVMFSGQVPLDAQYLIITADSISGVKVIFHKSY